MKAQTGNSCPARCKTLTHKFVFYMLKELKVVFCSGEQGVVPTQRETAAHPASMNKQQTKPLQYVLPASVTQTKACNNRI